MTFTVPPQSLGLLQGALNTAIGGVSTVTTDAALSSIRRIEGFGGLSDLRELTRPDNLARLAGSPALFQSVARVLNLPEHVEREVFQGGMAGTAEPKTSYAPTSCAMDMVGADFSHAAELPEVDLSQRLSTGEIAHRIFTDIRELQGRVRIHPMEQRLQAYAEQLSLSEGVQIYRRTPTAITRKLFQMLDLAVQVSKIMDDDAQGYFRETMHENHSRAVIVQYLTQARAEGPEKAIPLLERCLELYDDVYRGGVDLGILESSISRALKDELHWPKQVTLDALGSFAVSLRRTFEAHGAEIDTQQRYYLMRLAIGLDATAFGLGAFNPEETGTAEQALKMATLIEVLHGTGFGDERWLAVAERLRQVHGNWPALGPDRGAEELRRYGVLAAHMLEEVKTSYHSLFDDLVRTHGKKWGLSESDIRSFTRSLYRTSALFPLGQHLAALHAGNGNHNRSEQVLNSLFHKQKAAPRPYAPIFLGEGREDDLYQLGNKGKGLNELIRMGEPVPAGFALPPVLLSEDAGLNADQLAQIDRALKELESRTGKGFADGGLRVSIRSGAAVSMPGTLLTVIKVGSRDEAVAAVAKVYGSWNDPSAQLYRRINGVPEDMGTSVIVQEWIETNDDPASGFGLASSTGEGAPLTRYGRQVHGIDLVSGNHPGQDTMDAPVAEELAARIRRYEDHFHYPVEVEYAVERGRIWLLQVRRAQLRYEDEVRWAVQMIREGRMPRESGIAFLGGRERLAGALSAVRLNLQGGETVLASEAKGGGRPWIGAIALDETGITALQAAGLQAIFVTDNADAGKSAAYAFEAGAAIFNEGNGVSHLEGDLRASNRPHVGGIPVTVDREGRTATIGGITLKEGDVVTLDPVNGSIYRGEVPIQQGDSPVASLIRWLID
ncbi:MAG TPA: PEP/pyruvate-binding domain-containing protein [bacterium]|nr:PEP/pyruvate-binding domain-containing protein [bacterium]